MTEKIKLDFAKTRELIDRAIAEKGEGYIYTDAHGRQGVGATCTYFTPDGAPSCIVGHVFGYLGLRAGDMEEIDVESVLAEGPLAERLEVDGDSLIYLKELQDRQDDGVPWGDARQRTLEEMGVAVTSA